MKKLLYFTHVSWNWIKQRPQFIAENLSQYVELTYVEAKSIKCLFKCKSDDNKPNNLYFKFYLRIPKYNPVLSKANRVLDYINSLLLRITVSFKKYDYVWITSIESYSRIYKMLPKHVKIIYDCMDDDLEFPQICNNNYAREYLSFYEKKLIDRADVIICSAENLKQKIIRRTGTCKKITVINNATVFPTSNQKYEYRPQFKLDVEKQTMVYIGTIAKWFDFESVLTLLNYDSNLVCYLIGPVETELPKHDRIVYLGKCIHREIWGIMKQADVLLMPFVLNPLIESVNPVKLYEYIWAEKAIIATRYGESLKFGDYCYLYSSKNEILEIYNTLKENDFMPKQKSSNMIAKFINENSWYSRCQEIIRISEISSTVNPKGYTI